jgi:CubicO group peptidase (beta-lactamase class C family)
MKMFVAMALAAALGGVAHAQGVDAAGLSTAIAQGRYPGVTGVLVAQDGRGIFERHFAEGSAPHLNDTRSATKTLAALAVGRAIADGKIPSVDAPVLDYFPDRAPILHDDALKRGVTVADLLTMSSALDCDDNNESPGNEENMYPQTSWTRFTLDLPTKRGWERDATGRGPWAYCTAGAFLLGQIVERATGERIDHYLDRVLLRPLEIRERQWDRSPSGEFQTGGGLELTSRDLAKIAQMMLDGGRWHGRQIMPEAWVSQMMTPHRAAFLEMRYGYLMWTRRYESGCGPVDVWFMAGNGGNHVLVIPKLRATAVITRTAYNTRNMHQQSFDMVQRFVMPALGCR